MNFEEESNSRSDWKDRHGGLLRVYGAEAEGRLRSAHILVVGMGGVGSWTAEALARSGVGRLTLVDGDAVCVTNTNRQIIATLDTIGRDKVVVCAERVQRIHPECKVEAAPFYFTAKRSEWLRDLAPDIVVDAIDSLTAKCELLHACKQASIPVVCSGGAGGRVDPTQIRRGDLGSAVRDPLLRYVRKKLRREFGYSRDVAVPFRIPCIYTIELPVYPQEDGTVGCDPAGGMATAMDCGSGLGATAMVTGAMGLALAALALEPILKPDPSVANRISPS